VHILFVQFSTPEPFFLGSTSRLHCQLPLPGVGSKDDSAAMRLVDLVSPLPNTAVAATVSIYPILDIRFVGGDLDKLINALTLVHNPI
jgi:hypothetical protein